MDDARPDPHSARGSSGWGGNDRPYIGLFPSYSFSSMFWGGGGSFLPFLCGSVDPAWLCGIIITCALLKIPDEKVIIKIEPGFMCCILQDVCFRVALIL